MAQQREPVQIARDPFARETTYRMVIPLEERPRRGCTWCGREARFRYGTASDGRPFDIHFGNPFCSIDCERTYSQG